MKTVRFEDWLSQFPALVRKGYWESWLMKKVVAECFAVALDVRQTLFILRDRGALAACGLALEDAARVLKQTKPVQQKTPARLPRPALLPPASNAPTV